MTATGQTTDLVVAETVGAEVAPTLVAVLVLCGQPAPAATALVEDQVRRAVADGSLRHVADDVLTAAAGNAPDVDNAPDGGDSAAPSDPVIAALARLTWPDRLATVAALVLDTPVLGSGRPDEVAVALGARVQSWSPGEGDTLAELLTAAVTARRPPPEPGLVARIRHDLDRQRRRRRWLVAAGVVAVIVALVVVAVAGGQRFGDSDEASAPTTARQRIVQWVAVLDVGPDAFTLYPAVLRYEDVAGPNVFTDRWECYEGFGPDADAARSRGAWFLGIAANERETVDAIVSRLGRTPLVQARTSQICTLPPP